MHAYTKKIIACMHAWFTLPTYMSADRPSIRLFIAINIMMLFDSRGSHCIVRYLQIIVSRSDLCTSCEPNSGTDDSRGTTELCLGKPKSAHCKSSQFVISHLGFRSQYASNSILLTLFGFF